MNLVILICDILASLITLISLNLVLKSYKWWLLYISGTVFFVVVCIAKHIPGLTIMGICLGFTGIRNYRIGCKKAQITKEGRDDNGLVTTYYD